MAVGVRLGGCGGRRGVGGAGGRGPSGRVPFYVRAVVYAGGAVAGLAVDPNRPLMAPTQAARVA